jgi:hypothetical protein
MGLPTVSLPRETVTFEDGSTVEVRGLSRAEVLELATYENRQVEGEALALSWATGLSLDEVRKWHAATPFHVVQQLADVIERLSKTDADAGKGSSED